MLSISITPPADLPVTLQGARDFLQADDTDDDVMVQLALASATSYCESFMQRSLMARTVTEKVPEFPCYYHMLRHNPVISITHIKYYDADNVLQTLDASYYDLYYDSDIGYVKNAYNQSFPATYCRPDAVIITYAAGYPVYGDIPADLINAILLETRHAYDFRTNEKPTSPYRTASERLMGNYIYYRFKS